MLTVEYRTDPARVSELLPDGVDPAPEDPGAVALIWADWQSCGDSFEELLDPVRSQYKECFAVVRCSWGGETFSRCVFIWVDKDFALVRGYHQGYPKKLGSIWMTRPVTVGSAGPRLEPGGRFGATLAAADWRLAQGVVTLESPAPAPGFVNGHPMGSAELELFASPGEELSLLAPEEVIGGYYHRVGVSWKGGTTLRRNLPLEVERA
jgi:hypothetical protein